MCSELPSDLSWSAYESGVANWRAALSLSYERFLAFIAGRVSDEALVRFGSDLFLACACSQRCKGAISAFEAGPLQQAASAIGHHARTPLEREEVLQRVRIKLLAGSRPLITSYIGHGPLVAWLRTVVRRCAVDVYHAVQQPRNEWEAEPSTTSQMPDWDLARARFTRQLEASLAHAMGLLSIEERQLLRMHFFDGLSIDDIGRATGVHKSTAARRVVLLCERLRRDTEKAARRRFGIDTEEFRSHWMAFADGVEVSRMWSPD
jgi:RNA polymerase sigma-70 factor (ECF subfamily)